MLIYPTWKVPSSVHTHISIYSDLPGTTYNLAFRRYNNHWLQCRKTRNTIGGHIDSIPIQYLIQSHSKVCVDVKKPSHLICADASITTSDNVALSVYAADCLMLLITDSNGSFVSAIHAGWKGLLRGIIQSTLKKIPENHSDLIFWIGPCICQNCYQVSAEFQKNFIKIDPHSSQCFHSNNGAIFFDLRRYACLKINQHKGGNIYHTADCTYETAELPSYRKSQKRNTSRMFSCIWKG